MVKKPYMLFPLVLLAAVAVSVMTAEPVLSDRAALQWGSGKTVSLVVEQDGVRFDAENGDTIEIRRAPFVVWVLYTGTPAALLNVSPDSRVFNAIEYEFGLAENLGRDVGGIMGMAEDSFNYSRTLFLSTLGSHYLPNPTEPGEHRFNRLYVGTYDDAFSAGGRDVQYFVDQVDWSAPDEFSVDDIPYDDLYLTLIDAEQFDFESRFVQDYFTLHLRFRD